MLSLETTQVRSISEEKMVASFQTEGCVAFVTGANRNNGIGRAIVNALLKNGAKKVYATARSKEEMVESQEFATSYNNNSDDETSSVVVPMVLDVTDLDAIQQLPEQCPDVTLIVNNAGHAEVNNSLGDIEIARKQMEINYLGPMAIVSSLAPLWQQQKANNTPSDAEVDTTNNIIRI